jgi:protein-arginine kinase activator protein McsA
MVCQLCQKRPATVHITRCGPGEQVRENLCEVCAGTKTEAKLVDAGYRLDLERRRLYVERERTLFSDEQKSLALCNLACYSLSSGVPPDRIEYNFRPQGFPTGL